MHPSHQPNGRRKERLAQYVKTAFIDDAAVCQYAGVNMFPNPSDRIGERRALYVCSVCPVRSACLEHALSQREEYGVWGGMTARERLRIIRKERAHRKRASA